MSFSNAGTVNVLGSHFHDVHGNQTNYFMDSSSDKAFEALRHARAADAQHNSHNRYPPPCDPDTRVDVLGKISECLSGPGGQSCLLYGTAGSGKSAIAQSISEVFAKKGKLAASFFFNHEDEQRSSKKHVIATIAYQLAINIPATKPFICGALQQDETILHTVFENQLHRLVIDPLCSMPHTDSRSVIVIDALDECEDIVQMLQHIISFITPSSNRHFPIQCFITSRPEPRIRAVIEDANRHSSVVCYNLQDFEADTDLHLFFERRFHDLHQVRRHIMPTIPSPWPSSDKLDALVRKSSSLFIYASTVVKFIGDESAAPDKQLEIALSIGETSNPWVHADLDQLYKKVLSLSPDRDLLRPVIGAIIFLRTPLSPLELRSLLGIDMTSLLLVLEPMHSILSIPPTPDAGLVTTFHISLGEMLTSRERAGIYFIDPSAMHAHLAQSCLKRISALPKYTSGSTVQYLSDIRKHWKTTPDCDRISIRYACWYWPSHLPESYTSRKPIFNDMKEFCYQHTLPWLAILYNTAPNMKAARELVWEQEREREAEHGRSAEVAERLPSKWEVVLSWLSMAGGRLWALSCLLLAAALGALPKTWLTLTAVGLVAGLVVERAWWALIKFLGKWWVLFWVVLWVMVITALLFYIGWHTMSLFEPEVKPPRPAPPDITNCVLRAKSRIGEMPLLCRYYFNRTLELPQRYPQVFSGTPVPESVSLEHRQSEFSVERASPSRLTPNDEEHDPEQRDEALVLSRTPRWRSQSW